MKGLERAIFRYKGYEPYKAAGCTHNTQEDARSVWKRNGSAAVIELKAAGRRRK
jgi:hypothetical protein